MQGQLFTQIFLSEAVLESQPWQNLSAEKFAEFVQQMSRVYSHVDATSTLNEAVTENTIIVPTLNLLGWEELNLPQVNSSATRREDVPDHLLFLDQAAKQKALRESRDAAYYKHGIAVLEAKRWLRSLDRGDTRDLLDPGTPSNQILRYLSSVEVASDRAIRWGILTNGSVWRLYWQGARSRAEEFFEVDLGATLRLPGIQAPLDALAPEHTLKLFYLLFHREAFEPQAWDTQRRSFHAYALDEARFYEEKVSQDLGERVFAEIFPDLANALAAGDGQAQRDEHGALTRAYLDGLREATLVLLYRLLFVFFAEDRQLLPLRDARYFAYSIRRLREEIRDKRQLSATFSNTVPKYWGELQNLFTAIANGDDAIGLPAYNGGLFDTARAPILARTRVPDAQLAPVIDALSRRSDVLKAWINYRDLSVSHLGSIYERLLEYTLVQEATRIVAKPSSFARKITGSYYTHDDLVQLIIRETVGRLIHEKAAAFDDLVKRFKKKSALTPPNWEALDSIDPASNMLKLQVCDPAMGSGHFLVTLVDYLADQVLEQLFHAEAAVAAQPWAAHLVERGRPWQSPEVARIADIRQRILATAREHGWAVDEHQLDDRHIVRRIILKRVIHGVDKNPMAVELAKLALWLHTFTVGAPLSFLDHHLKGGDSLHGERFEVVRNDLYAIGVLLQEGEFKRLEVAARSLAAVADLTDINLIETQESKRLADEAEREVAPLHALLDFWRALRWIAPGWPNPKKVKDDAIRRALAELLSGRHNLAAVVAAGRIGEHAQDPGDVNSLLLRIRQLAAQERFFHWHTAFPTVWPHGTSGNGGFDAVIGNPPWDRIKLQQVEWFAERRLDIARVARAADRKRMIQELESRADPLWQEFALANERAEANARVARECGDFPLLSSGDINIYSLFVERAQALVHNQGIVGLLTPSGIAADKGAAEFFRSVSGSGRLAALYDFENKKVFFPDIHASFKFCALVFAGAARTFAESSCAFFLHDVAELAAAERTLRLTAEDFKLVNPNTGAAPIFRTRRDAEITTRIYREHPVLVDRSSGEEKKAWPVRYVRMFDMTNDSHLFLKRDELEKQGWKPAPLNRWQKGEAVAVPLYEGKMVQMYDHRAADVVLNAENLHRPAQQEEITLAGHQDFARTSMPQYWVEASEVKPANSLGWALGFKEITAPTNMRTMIAALAPGVGFGNKVPILVSGSGDPKTSARSAALLVANMNSFAFDFTLRQKIQGQTINLFILEQLPVIAAARFEEQIGQTKIADFIRQEVLRLSYSAWDLAPFARDLRYVDENGEAKPPFTWDEEDRRQRIARLDALFMHLYGLSKDDAAYILDTFPIVREQDEREFGKFRTKELVLGYMELIAAGQLTRFIA